jgi:hypothetical protein
MFDQGIKFQKKISSYPQPLNKFYTSSCATSHHLHKQAQTNKILLPLVLVNLIQFPFFCDFFFSSLGLASSTWGGALHNKIPFPFSYINDETLKKYIGA